MIKRTRFRTRFDRGPYGGDAVGKGNDQMQLQRGRIGRAAMALTLFSVAASGAVAMLWERPARGDAASAAGTPRKTPAAVFGDFSFTDIRGRTFSKADMAAHKATVFLFISGQCPISNLYTPRYHALASEYGKRDVQILAVYSDRQEGYTDIVRHADSRKLSFPVVKDNRNALADYLGAEYTPEAIVVDAQGAVRYRGRIDDNKEVTQVTKHDLAEALDAILAGKPVPHPRTAAFGCMIRRIAPPAAAQEGVPTYARDVAPILRAKCESCHRKGEVAPFSLQSYKQASAWSDDIKKYTQNGQMPPWKPAPEYGAFQDEAHMRLTEREMSVLAKWADAGAPMGDPRQIPPPRQFAQGWQLGQPDVIVSPDREFHLAADGDDVYRNFVIKTDFPEDRYLSAVECRPGNRAIVHHIINYVDVKGQSVPLQAKQNDGEPGYTTFGGPGFVPGGMLAGWAPGNDAKRLPDGTAMLLPKGACIVIQVHYHKNGKPETDQTKIGLHFARNTVNKVVRNLFVLNFGFEIPPRAPRHEVRATTAVTEDMHLIAVTPHMHLLGKEIKVWATLPGGNRQPLVWIKDWDFNWQATYLLKEPLALPKGTRLELVSYFDNSSDNPRNPNRTSPKPVTWGEQTTDEMCVAFATVTRDSEQLNAKPIGIASR